MKRNVEHLADGPFDLLVIGGGIYGAWTAYDAALRGLTVALVEKNDWAAGTSSASSKLIHGGLRYLEQFRFGLVRKSLEERKRLTELAPHRVLPLRFLIPIYRDHPVGSLRMGAGLMLYDLLAGKGQPVDRHERLGPAGVLNRYPFLKQEGLRAGYTYGDCQTDDARFTLEIIHGAYAAGAVVANYAEVNELLFEKNRVTGAAVTDRSEGKTIEVRASVVVNTAGPWATELCGDPERSDFIRLTKGVHLVLPPLPARDAILVMVKRDRRIFFLIPWYGKTLLGTTDTDFSGRPDTVRVEAQDIDYLLTEANRIFHRPLWDRSSISGSFAGLRALRNEPGKHPSQVTREWSVEEYRERLLTSTGGKFTSARADAEKLVDRVMALLNRHGQRRSFTESRPFPWSPATNDPEWREKSIRESVESGLDRETAEWGLFRYGSSITAIRALILKEPALASRLVPDLPFCRAEVAHGAASEMALHLEDLLRRRIPLLILSRVQRKTLEEAASIAAPVLGWTAEQCEDEVNAVMRKWDR